MQQMSLSEAKHILRKNGYVLNEDTYQTGITNDEYKLGLVKMQAKFLQQKFVNKLKNFCNKNEYKCIEDKIGRTKAYRLFFKDTTFNKEFSIYVYTRKDFDKNLKIYIFPDFELSMFAKNHIIPLNEIKTEFYIDEIASAINFISNIINEINNQQKSYEKQYPIKSKFKHFGYKVSNIFDKKI